MSQEITLEQALERAHQAEIICSLLEVFPRRLVDSEVSAIATLLKRLTGDVTGWLGEELTEREGKA
ncbi:TPA: hypothetical protein R4126_003787 [Klebsiella michiganensis]|nr:hypothetical protein [Klebsiella michiganensis]